jgi:hypothetical protein
VYTMFCKVSVGNHIYACVIVIRLFTFESLHITFLGNSIVAIVSLIAASEPGVRGGYHPL